jgi:predicted nuclease with TOPRIM domain
MQELELLHTRVDLLLQQYTRVQQENMRLKDTLAAQLSDMEQLNKQLHVLESALQEAQTARNTTALQQQIDEAIAEVDKILNLINGQE